MAAISDTGPAGSSAMDKDVAELHRLGYAQELRRRMGGFSNFAVSFTIISVLSGCLTLYFFGMQEGGPVDIVWGWILVGIMTTVVGLGMAEIASRYPTAGGLYYWSAKLAKNQPGAWSWFTGWFNLLGQVAITAGIDYGFAFFFASFLNMTANYPTTAGYILIIYAGILIIHGLLNTFGVRVVALLSDISVWWHLLGVAHHRRRPRLRPEPPRVGLVRLHEVRQPLGLPLHALRLLHRAVDGPVHLHRLRRLCPHVGGDEEPRHRRSRGGS